MSMHSCSVLQNYLLGDKLDNWEINGFLFGTLSACKSTKKGYLAEV